MNTQTNKMHELVTSHPVVLVMKGTPQFPRCGFSGTAVQVLKACGVNDFYAVDVLTDPELGQAAKDYAHWPTYPQLYIDGQFVGGADIMREMYQKGELQAMLAKP
ncbi:MAG: monothiol glutaredoxin, Grx4 family [Hydrogenophilales bacterium CG03_land_8_20_14_0_80_62_28]|nr:Grx4 family monothiol glutaredoxin [Betaproteobacteria bacterium]OIO77557.1 MAG: monothiol glutaredoxin, Grx4 family [Hydrogenophilaceae bacterium CG1_02_62_390]PIV22197.1 MAG: monothiol glutaredoxin, Grx4 family [Hydrogenophilales bacterium CG03_land_8_20_14_0_80_62_28]PIW38628.1 MAG: monothiol glutaredoxin, Grx4 family [Hydrogenophilales bacterium CG15_BIG_FIL_POST_REV_8_21_14_020_62_31]PIW72502.1 MAG: monothiol glutaredoxin, Grx4 family [Hydrogenophilales bacterium CG12_big_fil_rev_8_21_1